MRVLRRRFFSPPSLPRTLPPWSVHTVKCPALISVGKHCKFLLTRLLSRYRVKLVGSNDYRLRAQSPRLARASSSSSSSLPRSCARETHTDTHSPTVCVCLSVTVEEPGDTVIFLINSSRLAYGFNRRVLRAERVTRADDDDDVREHIIVPIHPGDIIGNAHRR